MRTNSLRIVPFMIKRMPHRWEGIKLIGLSVKFQLLHASFEVLKSDEKGNYRVWLFRIGSERVHGILQASLTIAVPYPSEVCSYEL